MANNEEIYQYLTGTTDNGSAINFDVETPAKNWGEKFEDIIYPVQLEFQVIYGHNVQIFIAYDGGQFKPISKTASFGINRITLDVDTQTGDYPRCQFMQVAFREISQSKLVIANFAVLYYLSSEVEELRDKRSNG